MGGGGSYLHIGVANRVWSWDCRRVTFGDRARVGVGWLDMKFALKLRGEKG